MDDLPDAQTLRMQAAQEALSRLGLLQPFAVATIMSLLESLSETDPQTACSAYQRTGEQLAVDEKRALGIEGNAFFNRRAFGELSDKGRAIALNAHELTLRRAAFVVARHREAVSYKRFMAVHPRVRMVVRYRIVEPEACDLCRSLDGTHVAADWGLFAPDGCACLTAPYELHLQAERYVPVQPNRGRAQDRRAATFLGKVKAFFARR